MPGTDTKIGRVTRERFEEIVAELREDMKLDHRIQFTVGDRALEVEPLRSHGGDMSAGGDDLFTVAESLHLLGEETGIPYETVRTRRWTASRWPAERRRADVPFHIHRILASIRDDEERFATIDAPPQGMTRWTPDAARRRVGHQVDKPETEQEKVRAIHHLAQDEQVAAQVTADFLRRPAVASKVSREDKVRAVEELTRDEDVAATVTQSMLRRPDVAFKAMSDDTARYLVNEAQTQRHEEEHETFLRESPVGPTVRKLEQSIEFIDLVGACHAFVTNSGRVIPKLRDRRLSGQEREVLHNSVERVRATCDWLITAVDTGRVDLDDELERLLRGQ